MLSLFRRVIYSRAGVIVTGIVLVLIALAFAAGDVSGLRTSGMASLLGPGNEAARVGDARVSVAELKARVQNEVDAFRQQQPTLDVAQYIQQGGFEGTLERLVSSLALERFGEQQGAIISKRAVDGEIASIPALQGPTGQFDPGLFRQILAQRKLSEVEVRADIARDKMGQLLTLPSIGATQVPAGVALPYAALLLERRSGQIAFVPTQAMAAVALPTDAELQAFYARNLSRYVVPERRVVRYATVTPASVKAQAVPTEAEVVRNYATDRARYAPTQTRDVTQVVVADQAGAAAIAAKVAAGATLADAAKAAGLEASVQKAVQRAGYAAASSSQVAEAVFAARQGAVVGPIKAPLGWLVVRIDAATAVAGRSLEQVRGDITATLTKQKTAASLGQIHDAIDDGLNNNATFDEIVADRKLAATTTRLLTATGTDPDAPGQRPDPALAAVVAAAFKAEQGDAPQMVTTAADGSFALVALGRVAAAAPRPFAAAREAVARDYTMERARTAARKVAGQLLARVDGGTSLAQAAASAGVKLPPVQPIAAARADLARQRGGAPPPLVLLFSMAQGTAKLLEAPQQGGWFVIKLDRVVPGDAARQPGVVAATRADVGRVVGREYVEQFTRAVRADLGTTINQAAVAKLRADLLGAGNADAN